ncbi:hypothetical protein [Desertivirga brevis]|uniref:hypothetical protein n=1 Tax=Desertivirga brevis TaxID=2810310 RepID=UPI001A971868|nr:hypothetical protein [Pedobacter sp. SYSU D00873]
MKKAFLVLALVAASFSFSYAQQGGGYQNRTPEERAKQGTERISEKVKLTADQKTKVEAILLVQSKSVDSLRTAVGQGGDRQQMFQKMQPIREQADKKIIALLTDEQKKAYAAYQEENRNRMGQGRRNGQGGQGAQGGQK